jgi:hypothetical protein
MLLRSIQLKGGLMTISIEHIDAIARKVKRDVLFVIFHAPHHGENSERIADYLFDNDFKWEMCGRRQDLIDWLDTRQIEWQPCGHVADPSAMFGYRGQIYINLPFDTSLPAYCALADYLEWPDGRSRFPDATFCALAYEVALENAAHDEPGFWEKWADGF